MVYVSKEPALFNGDIKLSILIDGEEAHVQYCAPQEAAETAQKAIGDIIRRYARHLLKQAPNGQDVEVIQLKQLLRKVDFPKLIAKSKNLALLEKHLPQGRLAHDSQAKFRQIQELAKYIEQAKTSQP